MKNLTYLMLVVSAAACGRHNEAPHAKELGEPIGAMIEAHGSRPAFEIAWAVERGVDPAPALEKLTAAAAKGVERCHAGGKADSAHLEGNVLGGRLAFTAAPDDGELGRCVAGALEGSEVLPGRAQPTSMVVELRLRK